jgi:uncharacterized membrane protein YvbJ
MSYCTRCGKQNPDDSTYCNNCGANLTSGKRSSEKEREDRCNEECSGRSKAGTLFWGIIIILVGIWVIFEFGIKRISGLPSWVYNFDWGWVFALVIGLAILAAGINMIVKSRRRQ